METKVYEAPKVLQFEITIEKGFATSTEPIGTDPEQGWEQRLIQ